MASSDASGSSNHGLYTQLAGRMARRVPGLKAVPVVRLIMAAELLSIGKHHLDRATPQERATLIRLVAKAKGRPRNLTPAEQDELNAIVEKIEPRVFLAEAADRISPVGVPGPLRDRLTGTRGAAGGARGAAPDGPGMSGPGAGTSGPAGSDGPRRF